MKTVVIGGNGFIGSHLVTRLLSENHSVIVFDPYPERFRKPIEGVEYIFSKLEDSSRLQDTVNDADLVFHLASSTVPQSSNESPILDIKSNLVGSIRLLQSIVKAAVKKLVFLSSGGTVYGIPTQLPVPESHPTNPICSHGIVKVAVEKYLHMYGQLHGLDYTILRPSNPFGPRQNPFGAQGAIAVFLGRLSQDLPVTIWGDGGVVRDYFYVDDLVEACLVAAKPGTRSPIYNVGMGKGLTLLEVLNLLSTVTGRSFNVINKPPRSFDVPKLVLDVSKAKYELGWEAATSVEEAIAMTWEWVQTVGIATPTGN